MTPLFIAEVSSNHQQSLERCFEFVDVSAQVGCDAVKFQLFKIDELFAPEILSQSEEHSRRRKWELSPEWIPAIAARCREKRIQFGCTPFYLNAVDELAPHVDFLKVASYELLWDDLLSRCAKSNKPVILSTGMATMAEVEKAVATLTQNSCTDLTLLQCVSAYPTPLAACNLSVINTFRKKFNVKAGWSDHTVQPTVLYRAAFGFHSDVIEFHLDLEGDGAEYEAGHCWLPHEIAIVIRTIREGLMADGNGVKNPVDAELPDRDWRADPVDGLRPLKHIREGWTP
ncbi:MAG: N-acetylneuraminate synthase family protein [Deltaproteobacteria bacterium]|nr:N-acetylneuraminate synthase family protein [Deltaproteobacteria bacterium]